jgi:small GTP-binding protein
MRILNEQQEAVLREERRYLNDLQVQLEKFGISADDRERLQKSVRQIDDLFMLVVVGEFNSGKSSLINALLGDRFLEEGVTPTTTEVSIIRFSEQLARTVLEENVSLVTAPAEILVDISIVDTPGTNAVIREHEIITSQFVPRADLVLFVTSADRPFTESERIFLEGIRDWGKKLIVVLNKCDIFQQEEDLAEVESFIGQKLQDLLGITPPIFPVSARLALRAKQGEPELWEESCLETLENHIQQGLDARGRLQLKFLNPLGVGLRLVGDYLSVIGERLSLLDEDVETLGEVEQQLDIYRKDMAEDFKFRMTDIENILLEMEKRGATFFEETMRLVRVFDLFDKNHIQKLFEKKVIADVPEAIEKKVNELIDWMVERDFRQWEAVTHHLAERRRIHDEHILGDSPASGFNYDRQRLIEAVGEEAGRVVETYDRVKEARQLAEGAQTAVAAAAVLEVGAVGLGTLVAMITTTVAVDVTGVLLASVLAVLGLFVIPARRRQAQKEMSLKVSAMREQLANTLSERFSVEMEQNLARIEEAVLPYSRFVRSERAKLDESNRGLVEVKNRLLNLKDRVTKL